MNPRHVLGSAFLLILSLSGCSRQPAGHPGPVLESKALRLVFDAGSGRLLSIRNQITGEEFSVQGDDFAVTAEEFDLTPANVRLESFKAGDESLEAVYAGAEERKVHALYRLGKDHNFFEKRIALVSPTPCRLKTLVVGRLGLPGAPIKIQKYPHQRMVTYFGRTEKGGIFLGLEKPFDSSSAEGATVSLGYSASLKVDANDRIESEPMYLGVYRKQSGDVEQAGLPLQSESDAMVAMTSAILGPPRHGFVPMACGWWCEMEHYTYKDEAHVARDLRSIDFLKDLGIDWLSDNHPWGGETDRMNNLKETEGYAPGPLVSKKYAYAQKVGVKVVFWPTMNNTHPWWREKGRPFLQDKREWLMYPEKRAMKGTMLSGVEFSRNDVQGNCIANRPFREWINRLSLDGMRTGYFPSWVMDGDFFGSGGFVIPVDCPSAQHDHLPGDSTWACERSLAELMNNVRRFKPDTYVFVCRPPMDIGVFYQRNVDAVFTIDEMADPKPLPGLKDQPVNVMLGDKIRKWSRTRVHHHFFPHYIDQPQVFVGPKSIGKAGRDWPSEAIDYVMVSALSCSPNHLYYIPTKAGMPENDKKMIRRWIDWGRKHEPYLLVRKDLPDWPGAGKVDGSAHILKDKGYVFLFNPNDKAMEGAFALDESIGLTDGAAFRVASIYPAEEVRQGLKKGEQVRWPVPPRTALILELAAQ